MPSDPPTFRERLGYSFTDARLLELALTHPSVAHERGESVEHNQRLEFLGDSVLGLVLTCELYEKFPNFEEGPLTKARAQLVNRRALAEQARRLRLGEQILLSKGEEINGGRERVGHVVEAVDFAVGDDSARSVEDRHGTLPRHSAAEGAGGRGVEGRAEFDAGWD